MQIHSGSNKITIHKQLKKLSSNQSQIKNRMEHKNISQDLGNKKIFVAFVVLSSLLGFIFLVTTLIQKPPLPHQVFSYFEANQSGFILFATLSLVWSVVTIPAIVALGAAIKNSASRGLSNTAILLTSSGILLNGIISFLYVGALLSIWNTRNMQGANSDYQMSIWTNLFYFMSDPALMIWGLGQLLFGYLLLSNLIFPKWLGVVTVVGGVAGALTLAVYQTPILAIVQELTLVILMVYFSLFLIRNKEV